MSDPRYWHLFTPSACWEASGIVWAAFILLVPNVNSDVKRLHCSKRLTFLCCGGYMFAR